jgi:hypothetical protein
MLRSEEIDKILPAIAKVKKELVGVTKGSNNPFYKSKYADLNTHLDEVEPLLEKEGLVLLQPPVALGENNTVESIIMHVDSGQYMGSSVNLVGESDMQKAGSAITYGRRYTLGGLLAIKALDDDGNTASGKTKTESKAKPAAKTSGTSKSSKTAKSSGFRTPKKSKPETQGDDW